VERQFLAVKFLEEEIHYDGSQLSPHWIYKRFGIMGDAAVAFIGSCDVSDQFMADIEDLRAHESIKAKKMLHFIVELFRIDTLTAVAIQSVFMSEIQSVLLDKKIPVSREGDDLYIGKGKLSISIASASAVSALIHIGLNITNEGTPVETSALSDFKIDPLVFANAVLHRLNIEYSRMLLASTKVKPRVVREDLI
jgi:uncharacterized protein